jgi:hypothetical protein
MTNKIYLILFFLVSVFLLFLVKDKVAQPTVEANASEQESRKSYVSPTWKPSSRNKQQDERENQFEVLLHDPVSARSFLLKKSKTPEFDSLIKSLDPELILQYLETQEAPYLRDMLNSRIYFILQKETLKKDPEQVVVNMKRLDYRWLEPSLVGEAFATFVMSNKDEELEYLGSLMEVPYDMSGEVYFEGLRKGNYSYIEGVDALHKHNPGLAYYFALEFFNGLRSKEDLSEEVYLLMTVKEKFDLIDFIRRRFEGAHDPTGLIEAVEDLPLLE